MFPVINYGSLLQALNQPGAAANGDVVLHSMPVLGAEDDVWLEKRINLPASLMS